MTLSFFNQFMSPDLLGIPMFALALFLPWVLLPRPALRWTSNRLTALQEGFLNRFVHQLFGPISQPGHKWALLFASLMIFLLTLNLLGLLPYTYTPTTNLSVNLGLAIPLWLAAVLIGMRNQPTVSLGHLLPEGTPTLLIPLLIIIETISLFIRPLALGVRLTANLTAGHLLMHLIATTTHVLLYVMPPLAATIYAALLLLTILEFAVAVIQAYVFVLLLGLYLQENV
uniref:ATP synthase subunit a n=1 Tax=Gobiosoma bosc TaxID=203314 RepID=A0A223GDD4_GOBBO|nr:ATP synthase subunit 6 [Gobiosoma bosc]AST23458.1 ATP synthase subunit 6 [Gobiosoma bosc]AST23480.1 ATP synthase subunit 6 [Gobiosoma bosc]